MDAKEFRKSEWVCGVQDVVKRLVLPGLMSVGLCYYLSLTDGRPFVYGLAVPSVASLLLLRRGWLDSKRTRLLLMKPDTKHRVSRAASSIARSLVENLTILAVFCGMHSCIWLEPGAETGRALFWGSAAAVVWYVLVGWSKKEHGEKHWSHNAVFERGRFMMDANRVWEKVYRALRKQKRVMLWGGLPLSERQANVNFAVCGSVGSGKTLTIRLLMGSVLPQVRPESNHRAVVFDAKGEYYPLLKAMGLERHLVTLDPFAAEGYAWDIAADVKDPAAAKTVSEILVPEPKGSREDMQYFTNAARRLVEGVMRVFIRRCPGEWTLQDLLVTLSDPQLLRRTLESTPRTAGLVEKYFEPERTFRNTISTTDTLVGKYEAVAAAWKKAWEEGRRFSLTEWRKSSSILVIPAREDIKAAMNPINRAVFARMIQLLASLPEARSYPPGKEPRTWVFLDEVAKAGRLSGLDDLLLKGRSKGVAVVLGFQEIAALHEEYGKEAATSILGQCGHRALLRVESADTARWASETIGKLQVIETMTSQNRSAQGGGTTYSQHRSERDAVMPSELMEIPRPSAKRGLSGFYLTPGLGAYEYSYRFVDLLRKLSPEPTTWAAGPQQPADQEIPASLSMGDLQRLNLPPADVRTKPQPRKGELVPSPSGTLDAVRRAAPWWS